jgi:hypothetical protein
MSLKSTAVEGVLERVRGGRATRMQALVSAMAAGAVVYKLLRSGADDVEQGEAAERDGAGAALD